MDSETKREVNGCQALTKRVVKNHQLIKNGSYEGWSITCYRGYRPHYEKDGVYQIEFVAYAKTNDLSKCHVPVLSDAARAIRVDFDNTSVVTLTGSNLADLTERLQYIFSGFHWKKEAL